MILDHKGKEIDDGLLTSQKLLDASLKHLSRNLFVEKSKAPVLIYDAKDHPMYVGGALSESGRKGDVVKIRMPIRSRGQA